MLCQWLTMTRKSPWTIRCLGSQSGSKTIQRQISLGELGRRGASEAQGGVEQAKPAYDHAPGLAFRSSVSSVPFWMPIVLMSIFLTSDGSDDVL